jgi:hypothetical protein
MSAVNPTYASVTKLGKVNNNEENSRLPIFEKSRYAFSSRFADILNEDKDDTDNSSFFNDQDPSLAWSKRYFEALDMPERNNSEKRAKYLILHCIHNDFVAAASTYAKTIISEHYLSDWRTLQPVSSIGGRGGEKYLVHGILFKFATGEGQNNEMFEGSDEFAAKAMGHEIKGVNSYIRTRTMLCYALQCLVDYKGFRMHCQAKLDIDSTTLKVGTADAGLTVKSEDPNLLNLMKYAAHELNIREHMVRGQKMYSAGDCEGHRGKDGRFYVVDLARVFPPEFPGCLQRLGLRSPPISLRQTVFVRRGLNDYKLGRITNVFPLGYRPDRSAPLVQYFDVQLHPERETAYRVPITDIERADQCIFWKFLRPEFVKSRGRSLLGKFEYSTEETVELQNAIRKFAVTYEDKYKELQFSPSRTARRDYSSSYSSTSSTPDIMMSEPDATVDTHPQQTGEEGYYSYRNGICEPDTSDLRNRHPVETTDLAHIQPSLLRPVSDEIEHQADLYALARPITDDDMYVLARPISEVTDSQGINMRSCVGTGPLSINTGDVAVAPHMVPSQVPPPPPAHLLMTSPKSPRSMGKHIDSYSSTSVNSSGASVLSSWMANVKRHLLQPPQPLSSDAFSGFANEDNDFEAREFEVKCATKELLFVLIPTMVIAFYLVCYCFVLPNVFYRRRIYFRTAIHTNARLSQ